MTSHFTSAAAALHPISPTAAWASFYASVANRLNLLNTNAQQKPYLEYVAKFQELAGPMTSLVADFLVNPVIRHARRLSAAAQTRPTGTAISALDSQAQSFGKTTPPADSSDDLPREPPLSDLVPDPADAEDNVHLLHAHAAPIASSHDMENRPHSHEYAVVADDFDYDTRGTSLPIREHAHEHEIEPRAVAVEDFNSDLQDASPNLAPPRPPVPIPEDDGMGYLRKRILTIQAQDLPAHDKAQLMHQLFVEKYAKAQISSSARSELLAAVERPAAQADSASWQQRITGGPLDPLKFWQNVVGNTSSQEDFKLTEDDLRPTYTPAGPDDDASDRRLGCQHYMRNVKLQCSTCDRWYTCRFCHDEVEDHELIRKDTKNMLCMYCGTAQKAGEVCTSCGVNASRYYCSVCKLWNNDPDKNVYHCDDCGICRVGRGIGKDFFHCKRCVACIAISTVHDHKCFERATDCDCPICGEYMFTSPKPVVFMKCGHSIHRNCFDDYMHTSYKCPICNRSVVNMEIQFRNLDLAIEAQPMPPELRDTQAVVLCNDCSAKSSVQYHWLGLKCGVCQSYNTAQLQITGTTNALNAGHAPSAAPAVPALTTAVQNVTFADTPSASPVEIPNRRDTFRRRRHSSSYMGPAAHETDSDRHIQNRLARSESPTAYAARNMGRTQQMDIEEEDEEDILGFWSRIPRSITSDDETGGQAAPDDSDEESEEETDDEDENFDDDDEDDDEETRLGFFMPGHR